MALFLCASAFCVLFLQTCDSSPHHKRREIQPTAEICSLSVDRGTCRGSIHAYFYNKSKNMCEVFKYSGCGGNSNRFRSLSDCSSKCVSYQPTVATSTNSSDGPNNHDEDFITVNITDTCELQPVKGNCHQLITLFYYDEESGTCDQFVYTGCGGNDNRFDNLRECEAACPPEHVAHPYRSTGKTLYRRKKSRKRKLLSSIMRKSMRGSAPVIGDVISRHALSMLYIVSLVLE